MYQEGDVVWVQDYHLMLLPALLKKQKPKMKVRSSHGLGRLLRSKTHPLPGDPPLHAPSPHARAVVCGPHVHTTLCDSV